MAKLDWQKARKLDAVRALERRRTRPPKQRRPKTWIIFLDHRGDLKPPGEFGFRLNRDGWSASFNRVDAMNAVETLREQGWHGRAKRKAPDRRTAGTKDRTATAGTINDRPA